MPLKPPIPPMEATSVDAIPVGPEWQYEPKWDGFRCLVFRDGDKVELQSKAGKPLTRYFPDVVASAKALPAKEFVLVQNEFYLGAPVNGAHPFDYTKMLGTLPDYVAFNGRPGQYQTAPIVVKRGDRQYAIEPVKKIIDFIRTRAARQQAKAERRESLHAILTRMFGCWLRDGQTELELRPIILGTD